MSLAQLGPEAAAALAHEELDYLIEEYTFMRSYGSGHEWACRRMGVEPSVFQRRLERNNLTHLI